MACLEEAIGTIGEEEEGATLDQVKAKNCMILLMYFYMLVYNKEQKPFIQGLKTNLLTMKNRDTLNKSRQV